MGIIWQTRLKPTRTLFDEDELKTLTDDMEAIRKIEEQITEMGNGNTASEDSDAKNDSEEASPFRDFSGQDYDGNTVDESLFSGNAVTVVEFLVYRLQALRCRVI